MRLKFIKPEDFVNYRKCSMFLGTCFCDWKCCHEANVPESVCHNREWGGNPIKTISDESIISHYLEDGLTEAVVIGGLEPMLQFDELLGFVKAFREKTQDDIVVYTGYYPDEIPDKVAALSEYPNIVIKFGRYVPNKPSRYDDVLGVTLASDNQFAKRIL